MATIRRAGEADIPSVLEIWAAAAAEPTVTDDEPGVRTLLAHDADALLVAEVDGAAVGTLIATWDGWRGHFYRLAVLPEAEHRLRTRGARRLNAIVVGGQAWATGFWLAAGYEAQAERLRFVKNNG